MARFRNLTLTLALLATGLGAAMPAASAQSSECFGPANNCFGSAVAIASPSTSAVNTTGFDLELGEPRPCGGIGATAWYTFTPSTSGSASVNTSGSAFDTVLAVYTGSSLGNLTNVGCNDDAPGSLQSRVNFTCVAGTAYRIQLGGYSTTEIPPKSGSALLHMSGCAGSFAISPPTDLVATTGSGAGQISLTWTEADSPAGYPIYGYHIYRGTTSGGEAYVRSVERVTSTTETGLASNTRYYYKLTAFGALGVSDYSNEASAVTRCSSGTNDCFVAATTLSTTRPTTFTATTTNRSLEPGEPLDCGASSASVWFRFTATTDGYATLKRTSSSGTSPILNIYTGSSVNALTWHGCLGGSSLSLRCVAGTTYYLQVASPATTATYSLEGCGRTGATTSTAENAVVGAHEGTASGPCWTVTQCRQNVGYDADAYIKVDTNPLTKNADGTFMTSRISLWGKTTAVASERSGTVGIVIVAPPPPPPPPGCGFGCEPGVLTGYAINVANWALQMEQWAANNPVRT